MTVEIPVKTKYDKSGVDAAERDLKRLQREAVASTRAQIAEHRKVAQLTKALNKDLAGPSSKSPLKDQMRDVVGQQLVAAKVLNETVGFLKDFTVQSVTAAASAERLGTATENLGRQYGVAGDAIVESIQKASQGTISQVDAMQSANQAMLLGVAKNEEEFDRLTKVAVGLGRAMGQDARKSVEDLTIGIGRQSRLILDNLGLIVNADAAYIRYAASVGKSVKDLTEAEKKQAFLNAALEQGEAKVSQLGDIQLDAAGKVERMTASYADFQVEFGKVLLMMGDQGATEGATNFIDRLAEGAKGWQSAIEGAQLLAEAQSRLDAENGKVEASTRGAMGQIAGSEEGYNAAAGALQNLIEWWMGGVTAQEGLGEKVQEVAKEQADLKKKQDDAATAAREQAKAEEAAAAAMVEAAAAAEKETERLEKVVAAHRDAAGELIDITGQAAEETAATWDEFFTKEKEAWDEHNANVAKIQAEAAKEAIKINKDLAKALAKEDKDAAKDIERIRRDSARAISRTQEDSARQERQQRRQRQIDTRSDQKLFNFDMRQLAAEGEFNQIQEAMERRAIEKQIEAQKQQEEDAARQENSQVEIDRMRQDAADQIAERQAQAEERKQELQEQAAEALALNQENLIEELAQEQAAYEQKMADLRQWRDDKLAEIEASKQESIEKLAEELTENKDLTKEEMEALIPVAAELGTDVGAAFADGLSAGFARNQRIDQMLSDISTGGASADTGPTSGAVPVPNTGGGDVGHPGAFAGGGRMMVHGAGGTDSQLVQFWATPGEEVTIRTPQQQQANAGGGVNISFTINAGEELAAKLLPAVQGIAQQVVDRHFNEKIVPWSNN